ncbi:hypothetical protein SAMN06296273_0065 [Nitrosomonas ureae]|uniref:Uncharacterized protein n=1 Tax=Nitrosomonas ureae TaxID=44577 RepID=A0A285BUS1_9PROT|nr:hypothetical protein SAMN06296273_0065 [Nitrosomonas ureae]
MSNKAPRRKQRGINCALQSAGFQPAFAPRGRGIKPAEIKLKMGYHDMVAVSPFTVIQDPLVFEN